MVIDPSTNIGKVRLRVADFSDIPFFPDSVYENVLTENNDNVVRASTQMAQYILGMLSLKTHRKLAQLETWGGEAFKQYKEFLMLTVRDASFMSIAPIPYDNTGDEDHPLIAFVSDWNAAYSTCSTDLTTF